MTLLWALACADAGYLGDDASSLAKGDLAPAFTLVDQDGEAVSLSDYAGTVVLVESAAEW